MSVGQSRFVSRLTRDTVALILAGGRGSRLEMLTEWRAKPAVPFGGKFRIIDFALSNCVNSGIQKVGVLTQYKSHSLIRHIGVKHDGCFLCRDNIEWQQSGVELGYEIDVDSSRYVAWMNPYPLMPLHCVIASNDHIPQAWCTNGAAGICLSIEKILEDLVTLSERLPGYVGFYNGTGAGASIPGHFHFQFFKRRASDVSFPLEVAARKSGITAHGTIDDYPIAVVYWRGDLEEVVESASGWMRDWIVRNHHQVSSISANILSTFDDVHKKVELFFVPRHQQRLRSPELSGMVGGLEVLGEVVFSSHEEGQRLKSGKIDYHTVERILAAVRFD